MFDLIQKCPRHSKRPWLLKKGCSVSSSFEQGGARFTFKGYVAVGDISLRVAFYPAVRATRSSPLASATLPNRARRIVLQDRRQSSEPGHPSDWSLGGRATSRISTHRNVVEASGSRRALRRRPHDRILLGRAQHLPRGAPHHPIGLCRAGEPRHVFALGDAQHRQQPALVGAVRLAGRRQRELPELTLSLMQTTPDRLVLDGLGLRLQRAGLVSERRGRECAQAFLGFSAIQGFCRFVEMGSSGRLCVLSGDGERQPSGRHYVVISELHAEKRLDGISYDDGSEVA